MTADLSPNARRELDFLAQVRGPRRAEAILIAHQRRDVGSCLCGWAELGKSHGGHQAEKLREAGLIEEYDTGAADALRQVRLQLAHTPYAVARIDNIARAMGVQL
jgi:hypothetical protein